MSPTFKVVVDPKKPLSVTSSTVSPSSTEMC